MSYHSKIIDELGGTSAVAKIFEIKPASVSEWREKGIPSARLMYLKLLHPELFLQQPGDSQNIAAQQQDDA